jgi:beta-glucanase (GH16 family)
MHRVVRSSVQPAWPFDEPFFLILNTAVGGALTGNAAADAAPADMLVDYVRVYAS